MGAGYHGSFGNTKGHVERTICEMNSLESSSAAFDGCFQISFEDYEIGLNYGNDKKPSLIIVSIYNKDIFISCQQFKLKDFDAIFIHSHNKENGISYAYHNNLFNNIKWFASNLYECIMDLKDINISTEKVSVQSTYNQLILLLEFAIKNSYAFYIEEYCLC